MSVSSYLGKKILVGVTGGIAAYKVGGLVRHFVKQGAEVRVIMTKNATRFVTPLTFETLSGSRVTTDIFPNEQSAPEMWGTHHVSLAQWPDVFLIAPAGANILGKIAHGIADDALSTVVLACPKPVVLGLAMNDNMYRNPAVQHNIASLKKFGYRIVDPETGFLAEGYEGIGRLAEPERLIWHVDKELFGSDGLKGTRILITAGPTQEALDPVRVITNHSSGKMGYALARQAALMGASVTLVAGPVHLPDPHEVVVHHATSAEDMARVVEKEFSKHDALIMSAAVADFKPAKTQKQKIKKSGRSEITLELTKTTDILSTVAKRKGKRRVVGFALETEDGVANAQKKLREKNLDFVVLNNPNEDGAGFNTDTNAVTFIDKKSALKWPLMSKQDVARKILEKLAQEL